MNEKQQQLTFEKGITTTPSDLVCSDNALEECVGMVYENGEHRVIQKPIYTGIRTTKRLVFIHKLPNGDYNLIYEADKQLYNGNSVIFGSGGINTPLTSSQISAVGNTLIVSIGGSLHYWLWKGSTYKNLTSVLEAPEILFDLDEGTETSQQTNAINASVTHNVSIIEYTFDVSTGLDLEVRNQQSYNNLVLGLYAKCLNLAAENKRFARPFLVRYAIELYDGSYTAISAPVVCYAGVRHNAYMHPHTGDDIMTIYGFMLKFKANFDFSQYSDIVRNVVVFATDGIDLYRRTNDQVPRTSGDFADYITDGTYHSESLSSMTQDENNYYYLPLNEAGSDTIKSNIETAGIFYKIAELGITQNTGNSYVSIDGFMDQSTLEHLTSNERLDMDYYSNCEKCGKSLLVYNNRLIVSNVERNFARGFSHFSNWKNSNYDNYEFFIYVNAADGERILYRQMPDIYEKIGHYFYYPDPRATKVEIFNQAGTHLATLPLKVHPTMNGAYYYHSLPSNSPDSLPIDTNTPTLNALRLLQKEQNEVLSSHVFVSEVNNPFTFKASGDITVETGVVIGAAPITQALSQGQFGQYPLIVFSTEGVFAVSVNNEGVFTSVRPMSREVALINNPCITQTDGAIFFASAKGLMVVVGNEVKCVSEQLSGKSNPRGLNISTLTFQEYLGNAFIAYDYRDSLLWIFNKDSGFEEYCYIYSIKSGTFSKFYFDSPITNVVNYYPDYVLQDYNGRTFSLQNREYVDYDENVYSAELITRPMKLENALALKSILEMKHIRDISGKMALTVYASNNVTNNISNWAQLKSLGGTPWKYYRFRYKFTELAAGDRFAGTIIVTQERRPNKLR